MIHENIKYIKGSWTKSCKSYYTKDNCLYVYLRKHDGRYNLDFIDNIDQISENKYFHNFNGYFRHSENNNFPKNIFQTHESYDYIDSKYKTLNAMQTWMKYAYKFNYQFYTNEMCEEFIKNNFYYNVYQAYMKLPFNKMKANLWKYCIIYKYGGIYVNSNIICKFVPDYLIHDNTYLICAPDEDINYLSEIIFAAPSNSPILKSIIDLVVERVLNKEIDEEYLITHYTGKGVFTDGIENYLKNNNLPICENKKDYSKYLYSDLSVFNYESFNL